MGRIIESTLFLRAPNTPSGNAIATDSNTAKIISARVSTELSHLPRNPINSSDDTEKSEILQPATSKLISPTRRIRDGHGIHNSVSSNHTVVMVMA